MRADGPIEDVIHQYDVDMGTLDDPDDNVLDTDL
jgi:hypothetical protein